MSRKRRAHKVKVERRPSGPDGNARRQVGLEEIHAEVFGLMEPKVSSDVETGVANIHQDQWKFSWWGGEEIKCGDTVTWLGPGHVMEVDARIDDRYRTGSRLSKVQVIDLVVKA